MDLDTLIQETVKRVVEGGKALGGDRISSIDIEPTVAVFAQKFLAPLGITKYHLLGSAGKKPNSGDIDLAVETDLSLEEIAAQAKKLKVKHQVFKGLDQVSVLWQQPDPSKTIQIDLIKGEPEYLKWSHPSPADSKYKGFYTRAIANAIIRATTGQSVNVTRGVFSKDDPEKKYSTDLAGLARAIGHGWTSEDLTQSLEKIWDKAKKTFTPEQLQQIREYVKEFMENKKAPFPEELNEAITPQSAAHQFERLKDVIIVNCPTINKVAEAPPGTFTGSGFAMYSPGQKAIIVKAEAPEPYKSYAVAHEAGHVKDLKDPAKFRRTQELVKKFRAGSLTKEEAAEYLDMESRAWTEAEWFLQKARIPIDNRFYGRRDKSMGINITNVKKVTIEDVIREAMPKIARGIVPAYGNARGGFAVTHAKGAQVAHGNIGGARNRGTTGYPVPPEMLSKRGQEDEVDGGHIEVLENMDLYEIKMFHGSPNPDIQQFKKVVFFTHDKRVAVAYAKEQVIKIKFDQGNTPTVYTVEVDPGNVLDFRKPEHRKRYMEAREEWNKTRERDDWMPHVKQEGFLMSYSSLPGWASTIYGKMMPEFDSVIIDEGSQGTSLAVFNAEKSTKIISKEHITSDPKRLGEAADPGELDWGIKHLDDLKPGEFMEFLKKYADSPLELEISEKVDGSARMSFGIGGGAVWTQTKTGTRKAMSSQYSNDAMFKPVKEAHAALESKKDALQANWPKDVAFMVAEVLYGKIPNAIEYGDNRLIIHGVHLTSGEPADDRTAKKAAEQVVQGLAGSAGEFKVEYKRTLDPKDVMVDVRVEYDTLGELYKSLQQKPRDKEAAANFKRTQKAVKEKLIKMLHSQSSAYGPKGGDVEGLVFRDLESGTMYKLVDKDYFKTLVDFMWSWRNRVNKEVMQGFREVVARDALGDASAAGNRLVSNILASGPGGTGNKDPARQADLLIANYIQQNDLMKPDFYVSFQRALMGAFEDLEKIKIQWEKAKDQKQSTTIQGKTREMGPDVKDRTTAAIQDAEAALKGIRAGMDVAENIKDPMTQKVALFKLFMGHRFQRLVDKIGGQELDEAITPPDDTEQRFAQLYPDYDDEEVLVKRGQAQPTVTQMEILKRSLNKIKLRVGNFNSKRHFVGVGTHAAAFRLPGGRVFKFTNDESDATASAFFMKNPVKHVVQVFDVFRVPKGKEDYYTYYGIVVEQLFELNRVERDAVDDVRWVLDAAEKKPWKVLKASLLRGKNPGDPPTQLALKTIQTIEKYGLDEMVDEFARSKFSTADMHSDNIMKRRDGTWVLSDLGASMSAGATIPVLEGGPIDRGTGWTDLSGKPRLDDVGLDDAQAANEASNWLKGITAATMMGLAAPTAIDTMEPPEVTNIEEPLDISAKTIDQIVDEASAETGVSPILIKAMMSTESGGDPKAVSPKGAAGLMQLMPGTAKAMGATDPHDPEQNVKAAAKYVAKLQKAFPGRLDWVLAAYNMGPNALRKLKGPEHYPQETKNYIKKVRAAVKRLKAAEAAKPKPIEKAVYEAINRLLIEAGMQPNPTEVMATKEFSEWYHTCDAEQQKIMQRLLDMLRQFGINLSEPYSYALTHTSNYRLRELRHTTGKHPLRISYGFTPQRKALVLIGDNKKGKGDTKRFTQEFSRASDDLWKRYNNLKEAIIWEADAPEYVGATIGRFQPFHAGHAKMIRQLAQKYTKVLVFVGGMTKDKNNPFDYDLRLEMMEKSLPDVWSKVKIMPAVAAGKGTGYMPLLLAEAAKAGEIERTQSVSIVVGEDRLSAVKQQVEHYKKYAGEPGYYMGTMEVEAIPGVKNDDDVDRVSGTRVRQAIAKGDRNEVRRLLDPHLVSDPSSLEDLLVRMEAAMKTPKPQATLEALVAEVMSEMDEGYGAGQGGAPGGQHTGRYGTSAWAAFNPRSTFLDRDDEDGDENLNPGIEHAPGAEATYQQMLRSPSTRMLPMANHGTPNSDLPGINRVDGEHEEDRIHEPTDLDEAIEEAINRILLKRSVVR